MSKIIFHADDFGRSPSISKIYRCIKDKDFQCFSYSIRKIHGFELLDKTKISKRLFKPLTDFTLKKSKENNIYNSSFIKLLFMPFFQTLIIIKKIKTKLLDKLKFIKKIKSKRNILRQPSTCSYDTVDFQYNLSFKN